MLQSFIKISNNFFDSKEGENMIKRIGHIGFTMYSYLLIEKQNKSCISISIKTIKETLNIKDTRTILTYLNILTKENIITIGNKSSESKIKVNDILRIQFNTEWSDPKHYTIMSEELFNDKIQEMKSTGWILLCLLSKLHNYRYGTEDDNHTLYLTGYSCPSMEIIMNQLGIYSKSTVNEYIILLENLQLISVIRTTRVDEFKNKIEKQEYKKPNNKYIVNSRIPKEEYFIDILLKQYEIDMKEKKKRK